ESLKLDDLQIDPCHVSYPIAKFDLSFNVYENGEQLGIGVEYATDLFEETTIKRMADHFKEIARSIVESPQQGLQVLPFLTHQEQHQILLDWNATKAPYPEDRCIHELFE